jgi:hypothetical protein
MRKLIAGAALTLLVTGAGGATAFAGEVTGGPNPKSTPVQGYVAASICSFSGQEDGVALVGFGPNGPIFETVATGPGLVQTPHMENSAGIIHPAGMAGDACRGNGGGEG